jgi:hypothetical protein
MASVACAVSPVGTQSAASPASLVRYQGSSSSSPASTSASFSALPSVKIAASAFVAQQPFVRQFHGRWDSRGAALSFGVVFDDGLVEGRKSRVSKVGAVFNFFRISGLIEFFTKNRCIGT